MENEVWKPVVDYEGLYEVSNLGRIKSTNRRYKNTKMLTPSDSHGYLIVTLCKNGKPKRKSVHRLVATAFIDNPNDYPVVNHINEIKNDNRVENLEWCSTKYNVNYYFEKHPDKREEYRNNFTDKNGKHFNPIGARKRKDPIAKIDKNLEIICIYKSAADAGRNLGIRADEIYDSCKRNSFYEKRRENKLSICHNNIFLFLDSERLSQFERNRELIFSYKNTHLCEKQKTASSIEKT